MRNITFWTMIFVAIGCTARATGHGFNLSVTYNASSMPQSIIASSQEPILDQDSSVTGPSNLFLSTFENAASDSSGTYFATIHGFAQTSGPWLPYTATFNVISPLYFSNGLPTGPTNTGPAKAIPAPAGTYVDVWDIWAGNPEPTSNPHPGASFGDVYVNGSTGSYSGFGVSLYDSHELEKDLYIGSGPTNGEYGFAYNVVVHFSDGVTLTTGPLVDVFAIADPNYGAFAANAPLAQQDAATQAIYNAVTAVPEPGSMFLLIIGGAFSLFAAHRSKRNRSRAP